LNRIDARKIPRRAGAPFTDMLVPVDIRAERSAEADMLGVTVPVTEETVYSLICRVALCG